MLKILIYTVVSILMLTKRTSQFPERRAPKHLLYQIRIQQGIPVNNALLKKLQAIIDRTI